MRHLVYLPRGNNSLPSLIAIGEVIDLLEDLTSSRRVVVITDENVGRIYNSFLEKYTTIVIQGGEINKSMTTVEQIHRQLLALEADRDTLLVGFGGGIVTDITGFAASTYMRGLDFGFVATSFMAQVDASVGGKNGVNIDGYKNIAGTFNQPSFVLCESSFLATLPDRELRAGLCEALKCGIIGDPLLFEIFNSCTFEQIKSEATIMQQIIVRSVEFKAAIVIEDEHEHGRRKLLNLGHTFGHAIEKSTSLYNHGEAVAIGISVAASLSKLVGTLSGPDYLKIIKIIDKLGLPTHDNSVALSPLIDLIRHDKKRSEDHIDFVIIDKIGSCSLKRVAFRELEKFELS